ncbi:helix-turn-helix transcriptional regulator [Pseudanabaenaceae cyanobacterium LEGE 13415]|nr:helix-turn-helix transcriptional regulator [Pseudanabaenaceae cyanobacterium LEGE 13415]
MAFHQNYLNVEQPAVGQLVRELRQTLKLTQEKFATQLGVSFPTINRWENGHATPSPLAIKQLDILLNQLSESSDATLRERGQAMREKYFFAQELKA